MKTLFVFLFVAFSLVTAFPENALKQEVPEKQPSASQPTYQTPLAQAGYIPHATYPYADRYGPASYEYEEYQPSSAVVHQYPQVNDYTDLFPSTTGLLVSSIRALSKVGLFLVGGVTLLIIGGIFTTAVCSLTPLCTITFAENGIAADAAAFVEKSVEKFARMQKRSVDRRR